MTETLFDDKAIRAEQLLKQMLAGKKLTADECELTAKFILRCIGDPTFNEEIRGRKRNDIALLILVWHSRSYSMLEPKFTGIAATHQKLASSVQTQLDDRDKLAIKEYAIVYGLRKLQGLCASIQANGMDKLHPKLASFVEHVRISHHIDSFMEQGPNDYFTNLQRLLIVADIKQNKPSQR